MEFAMKAFSIKYSANFTSDDSVPNVSHIRSITKCETDYTYKITHLTIQNDHSIGSFTVLELALPITKK